MSLKRYDSAIMFSGKNTGIFFTNPVVALKVSHSLNNRNKHLTYKVYKLSKDEEKRIDKSVVVSTMEEYRELVQKHHEETMKKIQELQEKYHLDEDEKQKENTPTI